MRALALLMIFAGSARAADCEPSADIAATIGAAGHEHGATERLKHLVAAHPDDVFAHEAYGDQASITDYAAVREDYKKRYEKSPNDPKWAYLYARLVSYANAKEALALSQAINYPRVHLFRAARLAAKDMGEKKGELAKYLAACPDAIDAWNLRIALADKQAKAGEVEKMRKALSARSDRPSLVAYGNLWKAEFKNTPPAKHAQLRKQVAADLERMRTLAKDPDGGLARVLDEGYQITGDSAGEQWVRDRSPDGFARMRMEFEKAHPSPKPNASKAEIEAYRALQWTASAEWVKKWPDDAWAWSTRIGAAPETLPNADIKAMLDKLLALDEGIETVADVYVERGIELQRVPDLLGKTLARQEKRWASMRAQPERFPGMAESLAVEENVTRFGTWATLTSAYQKLHDLPKLRATVEKMKAALDLVKPDDEVRGEYESWYWSARAHQAWAENKKADALGYFARSSAAGGRRLEVDDELEKLWKEMGGSDEGWRAFTFYKPEKAAENAGEDEWKKKDVALPPLVLSDPSGKTWKSADWKGKTVLLVAWATWCGPCKMELPFVEQLYQQTKNRKDVVVATLNLDFEPGVVQPFLKENKYSFPVLLANDWAQDKRPGGIPMAWIADRSFTLRLERVGYDPEGHFVEEMLKAMDQVAKARE